MSWTQVSKPVTSWNQSSKPTTSWLNSNSVRRFVLKINSTSLLKINASGDHLILNTNRRDRNTIYVNIPKPS